MANSKIEFKIGNIKFIGEGEQKWLSEQLDKILESVPKLSSLHPIVSDKNVKQKVEKQKVEPTTNKTTISEKEITETLASFLKTKNATGNQRRKFLATAVWLQLSGKDNIVTKDISDALKNAKHNKITNPSDKLSQNIRQGLCEKNGKGFYVTPQGISKIMD